MKNSEKSKSGELLEKLAQDDLGNLCRLTKFDELPVPIGEPIVLDMCIPIGSRRDWREILSEGVYRRVIEARPKGANAYCANVDLPAQERKENMLYIAVQYYKV